MRKSNYPTTELSELSGSGFASETIGSLMDLSEKGIPKSDAELSERVTEYFTFCKERDHRPGVESLCLALATSRQNFWKWCNGDGGKSDAWRDTCLRARQLIFAFLEAAGTAGKLNPSTLIWLQKNWCGYSDSVTVDIPSTTAQFVNNSDIAAKMGLLVGTISEKGDNEDENF